MALPLINLRQALTEDATSRAIAERRKFSAPTKPRTSTVARQVRRDGKRLQSPIVVLVGPDTRVTLRPRRRCDTIGSVGHAYAHARCPAQTRAR